MKIRNQLILTTIVFGVILLVVFASIVFTSQQVTQINKQEQSARSIQASASNLAYLSNDYFLYQDTSQLSQWKSTFSYLSGNLTGINPSTPKQEELILNINNDTQRLNTVFDSAVTFLQNAPLNQSVRILPTFQTAWGRLAVQNQALSFDASVLANNFSTQSNQLQQVNNALILTLIAAFSGFFLTTYLIVFRRTLISIKKLDEGTKIIGSGNLDYSIASKSNDEVGDLSRAFNNMTLNLKNITASRADLENEIAERKKVEQERGLMLEFLKIANSCTTTNQLVESTLSFFYEQSGCEAVGIRLKDGEDFPYYETRGFPPEHILLENNLCKKDADDCIVRDLNGNPILECMCGNILCGRFDPSKQFFTEKGSFWTNSTTQLLATTTDADRQANTRNRCNGEGYESVALLALQVGSNKLGLLQLNDKRKNLFTLENIQKWERIADSLSLALSKTVAEESLRRSEQRWSTTLASIGDAVISTDLKSRITFMNDVAEELTGWTLSEASQKLVTEIFNIVNEQTRLVVDDPVSQVLEKGLIVGLANHTVLIRKDGSEIPIDDSGAPIVDKDGKISGVVLIFRDITERKKAEAAILESEERFSKAFHNSPIPQMITRFGDWRYVDANESVANLLEYSREELIGHTSAELNLIPIDSRNQGVRIVNERGELRDFEIPVRTKSGKIISVLTSTETIMLHGQKHLINTFTDVTIRKQMQAKLEEYSKHLEELVEERTKQLKDSERLAAIGATAGMVGHDIRNPLQAITGDLYLAKTELAGLPENEQKANALESLDEIEHNIDYINKIVADLQDYARPLNPRAQETNIGSLFNEILAKNGIPKNIEVTVEVENKARKIIADPDYLKRIFANLALNAVQAMPDGGKLTIHAYPDKRTNDVLITVKDTGVGIPENVKPKLFTPMMTTKSKGQGFGLAVVKRMTEGLGGTVTFESTEGKGTTFIVRFPSAKGAKR